jgi:hypothetical protein
LLAPGTVIRPNLQSSPWQRFNVAACGDADVMRRLEKIAGTARAA